MLLGGFLLQVPENLLNDLGVLDAGNHFDLTAAVFTDFDIDIENSFQSLHPGHGTMSLCGTLVLPIGIGWLSVGLLATLGRRHLNAVFAVGREDAVETCEVDSWLGYQRGQFGNEVQRLKDHMSRAIAVRSFSGAA